MSSPDLVRCLLIVPASPGACETSCGERGARLSTQLADGSSGGAGAPCHSAKGDICSSPFGYSSRSSSATS